MTLKPHNAGCGLAHNVRLILLRCPTRLHDGSCTGNVNASKRNLAPSKIVKNNGREARAENRKHWSRHFRNLVHAPDQSAQLRKSFIFGWMRGCHCARNVIAGKDGVSRGFRISEFVLGFWWGEEGE